MGGPASSSVCIHQCLREGKYPVGKSSVRLSMIKMLCRHCCILWQPGGTRCGGDKTSYQSRSPQTGETQACTLGACQSSRWVSHLQMQACCAMHSCRMTSGWMGGEACMTLPCNTMRHEALLTAYVTGCMLLTAANRAQSCSCQICLSGSARSLGFPAVLTIDCLCSH